MKFAVEGMKLLFLLNGAATISVLTFIGNNKLKSLPLIISMGCFAVGAAVVIPALFFAYLTQLHYGIAIRTETAHSSKWAEGVRFHYGVYWAVAIGLLFSLVGVTFAGYGLLGSVTGIENATPITPPSAP